MSKSISELKRLANNILSNVQPLSRESATILAKAILELDEPTASMDRVGWTTIPPVQNVTTEVTRPGFVPRLLDEPSGIHPKYEPTYTRKNPCTEVPAPRRSPMDEIEHGDDMEAEEKEVHKGPDYCHTCKETHGSYRPCERPHQTEVQVLREALLDAERAIKQAELQKSLDSTSSPAVISSPMTEPTDLNVLRVLLATRTLLTDPKKWTRHWYAFDANGVGQPWNSPQAVCFCIRGAIARTSGSKSILLSPVQRGAERALQATLEEMGLPTVLAEWNDAETTTHADVLSLLDRTIDRLQSEVRYDSYLIAGEGP